MRIKATTICKISVILLIVLASFLSPIQEILSQSSIVIWYLISIMLLIILVFLQTKISIKKNEIVYYILLLIIFVMYMYNNQYLKYHNLGYFMIGFTSILIMLILPLLENWSFASIKTVAITSAIHIFATYYFLIFPSQWRIYSNLIFGSYVTGTQNGTLGYTAALNGHYSTNGTLVAFGAICAMICFFNANERIEKNKFIMLMIIAVSSVLLTQKRAHILFFAITFLVIYFFWEYKRNAININRILKLIVFCLIVRFLIPVLYKFAPALSTVFDRFLTIGEDAQTLTRFTMWEYAIQLFSSNKIIGIGWGGYRYRFVSLDMYEGAANAHNIYLQLLAETGIIGFSAFTLFVCINLYNVMSMLINRHKYQFNKKEQSMLLFSVGFQIFLLLYGFTGNPIYDFCFIYYALSVAIGMNLKRRVRRIISES